MWKNWSSKTKPKSLICHHPVHILCLYLLLIYFIAKLFVVNFLKSLSYPKGYYLRDILSMRLTCETQMHESEIIVNNDWINRNLMRSIGKLLTTWKKFGFNLVLINKTIFFLLITKKREACGYVFFTEHLTPIELFIPILPHVLMISLII